MGAPVLVPQRMPRTWISADLSPDGALLAVASHDGVRVIDLASNQIRGVLAGCADETVFAPDGRSIVVRCRDTNVARIWDLAADKDRQVKLSPQARAISATTTGACVAARGPGVVDLIDTARGAVTTLEIGDRRDISGLQVAPNGWSAAIDREGVTHFSSTGKLVRRIARAPGGTAFSLGSSGKRLALATSDEVTTFDVETGKERLQVSPCPDGPIQDVEWSSDEQRLLVACGTRSAKPARVIVLSLDGVEERELLQADRGGFYLRPRGDRVGIGHPMLGMVVVDIAAGHELYRLKPPFRATSDRRSPASSIARCSTRTTRSRASRSWTRTAWWARTSRSATRPRTSRAPGTSWG